MDNEIQRNGLTNGDAQMVDDGWFDQHGITRGESELECGVGRLGKDCIVESVTDGCKPMRTRAVGEFDGLGK